jgi:hypothetical protein
MALNDGNPGVAMQLHSLNLSHQQNFRESSRLPEGKVSRNSFEQMLWHTSSVRRVNNDGSMQDINFTPVQKAEVELSRNIAETGRWPTAQEIEVTMRKYGAGNG